MKKENIRGKKFSWFWKWFLNNQVVTGLLIVLLCLLILFLFTKVSYLFLPLWQFFGIVGLPIILSGLLYYILNPMVDFLEKKNIPRTWSIIGLFIGIIALIIWGFVIFIPVLQDQFASFTKNWPSYWKIIMNKTNDLLSNPLFSQFKSQIQDLNSEILSSFSTILQNISKNTFQGLGNVIGAVATVVLAIFTMPFILFYLLRDGKKLPDYFIQFIPVRARKSTLNVLTDVNKQVSQYIRGQLTIAFSVAIMFIIGFSIIGLDYSITLGVIAGFLNLIPYLGSFLAMIPAVLLAIVVGPIMLLKVAIVFAIEQTIEGRVVSPLVLGSQLSIHPITIIFVLLTSGKIFGIVGVMLGIPAYAALKVIISHLFEWYKKTSGLYKEDEEELEKTESKNAEL